MMHSFEFNMVAYGSSISNQICACDDAGHHEQIAVTRSWHCALCVCS